MASILNGLPVTLAENVLGFDAQFVNVSAEPPNYMAALYLPVGIATTSHTLANEKTSITVPQEGLKSYGIN